MNSANFFEIKNKIRRQFRILAFYAAFILFFQLRFAAFGEQNQERCLEVASWVVEMMNSGNFDKIETKFSKQMQTAMPSEKSQKFFSGVAQEMGKFLKFGNSRIEGNSVFFPTEFERGAYDLKISLNPRGEIMAFYFLPIKRDEQSPGTRQPNPDSYPRMAAQLGKLINAADYPAIWAMFNNDMKRFMPLEETKKFLGGLLNQAGKIQRFADPRNDDGWTVFPTQFEKGNFDLRISLDDKGLISGLAFNPPKNQLQDVAAQSSNAASLKTPQFKSLKGNDLKKADTIAREAAAWFTYTTDRMNSEHLGQCGDYAVWFILKYNEYAGENVARLVTTNNPVPSGTYRLGLKTDVAKLGFHGFPSGTSGFLILNGKSYVYHPVLGAYPIYLEKAWTPKRHFGVNMLDKNQVHTWACIGDVSVDPTYFDCFPEQFQSPIGTDE